jgi:hypothetical protein
MALTVYRMGDAPLQAELNRLLCNRNPQQYELEWRHVYLDGLRELWIVRRQPGPRGAAGALYRVIAPPYRAIDLPRDWIGRVQCDCIEAQNGARRLGGICKHALMVYAWQGAYNGTGARWLYLDCYLRKFCADTQQHTR